MGYCVDSHLAPQKASEGLEQSIKTWTARVNDNKFDGAAKTKAEEKVSRPVHT